MRDIEEFEELLGRELPDLTNDLDLAIQLQFRLLHRVAIRKDIHRSTRIILNLAVGDLTDLVEDTGRGAGRSAMRVARALIEAAINMHTVIGSPDDADRYLAHLELGPILLAEIAPGHDLLSRKARGAYLHRLRRDAKAAESRWSDSIARYGSNFQRSWHPMNLKDRATRAGRPDVYVGYRMASLVAHGSAAGVAFGQLELDSQDRATFLAGRVPYLGPTALLLGIDAYLEVLKALKSALPEVDTSLAWDSLQAVAQHWPAYASLVDSYMASARGSGKQEGPSLMTYAAFSRGGRRRWYARTSFDVDVLMQADEPDLSAERAATLDAAIGAYRADPDTIYSPGGWAAFALPGAATEVLWTRRAVPLISLVLLVPNGNETWTVYSQEADEKIWPT